MASLILKSGKSLLSVPTVVEMNLLDKWIMD
jgi:hypothetical protein